MLASNTRDARGLAAKLAKMLVRMASVAAALVKISSPPEQTDALRVTSGPLSRDVAQAVCDKLRAGTADLVLVKRALQDSLVSRVDEPSVCSKHWSFGEAVLHAALEAVAVQFVGPAGQQTRLERSALQLFKEDGDLVLRPHVLWNELSMRSTLHGEEFAMDFKEMEQMIAAFDARSKIQARAFRIENDAIEKCMEASDTANVRGFAQSEQRKRADAAEADLSAPDEEPAPQMTHVGVLDDHEQAMHCTLRGLSDACAHARFATEYDDPAEDDAEAEDDAAAGVDPPPLPKPPALPMDVPTVLTARRSKATRSCCSEAAFRSTITRAPRRCCIRCSGTASRSGAASCRARP